MLIHIYLNKQKLSGYFLDRFVTNVPECLKILGLVLKNRPKLRIVDKSMPIYNKNGVFISSRSNKSSPATKQETETSEGVVRAAKVAQQQNKKQKHQKG